MQKYIEAIISRHTCFLEEECWRDTLRYAILEYDTFSDCSEILISLWLHIVLIPRLFNEVQIVLQRRQSLEQNELHRLNERIFHLRSKLKDWRTSYDALINHLNLNYPSETADFQFDRRFEALGTCISNIIILNRLATALNPAIRLQLEDETQALAAEILALEHMSNVVNPRAHLFMAFKVILANSALETEAEWRDSLQLSHQEDSDSSRLVPWPVFKRWMRLKGRRV
jgi:hypothetical protein